MRDQSVHVTGNGNRVTAHTHAEPTFPHCDAAVLHAPGECRYCDECPEWQQLREHWRIAFTGHEPAEGDLPCPSDYRRGPGGAHVWPGNTPRP